MVYNKEAINEYEQSILVTSSIIGLMLWSYAIQYDLEISFRFAAYLFTSGCILLITTTGFSLVYIGMQIKDVFLISLKVVSNVIAYFLFVNTQNKFLHIIYYMIIGCINLFLFAKKKEKEKYF